MMMSNKEFINDEIRKMEEEQMIFERKREEKKVIFEDGIICPNCGSKFFERVKICEKCGVDINSSLYLNTNYTEGDNYIPLLLETVSEINKKDKKRKRRLI